MGNMDYSDIVFDHFQNPRNLGVIENPDGEATIGNPSCGDVMKLMVKVKDGKIEDVKFQTFGCAAAIASSSMATVMVKGKTLEEAKKVTNKDVSLALGKLPPIKMHCSNLAADALRTAIENYESKK